VTLNENAPTPGAPARLRQVTVTGTKLLAMLKVGQTVVVDFATNVVTVAPTGLMVK